MNEPTRPAPAGLRKALAMAAAMLLIAGSLYAARSTLPPTVAAEDQPNKKPTPLSAVAAAEAFLDSLDAKQRTKATLDFSSTKKSNWSNLPVSFVPRNGVRVGDLTKDQRARAMAVVAAVLSKTGYQKVLDIMDGDQKVADEDAKRNRDANDRRPRMAFGADEYFLAIFGTPSATKPWMVQFGGHHLGVNVTLIGKNYILTPTHTGAQPALFKRDNKEVRPLGQESDAAFKLVTSLDKTQRPQAVIADRPQQELLLGPGRDDKKIDPKGIKGSALTADQQALLLDVIAAWVDIAESEAAAARLAEIKTKLDDTYFAWSGPIEKSKPAYFRIQGPTLVIEYAPQGSADHIHTVIRNPTNDYGAGSLKQ
jgi:hypothetical protein